MMKKIAVIGHYAFGKEYLDGQTVKTKILTQSLCEHFGEDAIRKADTHGWSKKPLQFMWQIWQTVKQTENVVMLPAHNGLRVIAPLLCAAKTFHRQCKLHYAVIGGWLPKFLGERPVLQRQLKNFEGIYVETQSMKHALEKQGFTNILVMPNCKELPILSPEELLCHHQEPYKLCTFSRVMKEKGIEDALEAVRAVNIASGRTVYALDIYGPVAQEQAAWFEELQKQFPEYVRYCGSVPFDQSVAVLKDYFALLCPTRFYTEGIPGTIIDAYAAGVPVISARWESFADVVEDQKTGYGFPFGEPESLCRKLTEIAAAPEMMISLKENCLRRAEEYAPQNAIGVIVKKIEGK